MKLTEMTPNVVGRRISISTDTLVANGILLGFSTRAGYNIVENGSGEGTGVILEVPAVYLDLWVLNSEQRFQFPVDSDWDYEE